MNQLEMEVEKSRAEVEKMRNEKATFLHTERKKKQQDQKRNSFWCSRYDRNWMIRQRNNDGKC